jgi:hypothetical protein
MNCPNPVNPVILRFIAKFARNIFYFPGDKSPGYWRISLRDTSSRRDGPNIAHRFNGGELIFKPYFFRSPVV